ncbi:MAG TPA: hypothetical protein VEJ18_04055 [Planctomycetota bacterium]|nr:hypothetical protein [Planctomycetota bacterium]
MSPLLVVRAPGLTPEQASRGDLAAHISDIIADGSFARLSGPPDLGRLPAAALKVIEVPFTDVPSFDAEVGRLRDQGLPLAIVSDSVLITQRWFKDVKPGAVLAPSDAERLLAQMAG